MKPLPDPPPTRAALKLPELYPKQHEGIFTDKRYAVIEATTKSGKTVGCIVWIMAQAWKSPKPGRNYWWVAPVFPQTAIAFRRLCRMLAKADPQKNAWDVNRGDRCIHIKPSDATIWFKSADNPDSLYGEDVHGAVVDEAPRCKEESWYAIRSTLTATRGMLRIIGNVKGRRNWVYAMARKAEAGEKDHHYCKLTCYDAVEGGILDLAEIEQAKRDLPPMVFQELYLAEAADDHGNPFGHEFIRQATHAPDDWTAGDVVVWGADLGKHIDWSVLIGLDADGRIVSFHRFQADWQNTRRRLATLIGHLPALVDATGVGDPIVEDLQRDCPLVEGFTFTSRSKQQIMEGLALALHRGDLHFHAESHAALIAELNCFEYEYTRTGILYTAPTGMHDDCVCALALAQHCRHRAPTAPVLLALDISSDDDGWLDDDDYDDD